LAVFKTADGPHGPWWVRFPLPSANFSSTSSPSRGAQSNPVTKVSIPLRLPTPAAPSRGALPGGISIGVCEPSVNRGMRAKRAVRGGRTMRKVSGSTAYRWLSLFISGFLGVLAIVPATAGMPAGAPSELKVAFVDFFSGPAATFGVPDKNTAVWLVDKWNQEGGLRGV